MLATKAWVVWKFNSRTSPIQAASMQCAFGSLCFLRLNFVCPPLLVVTSRPVVFNLLNNFHRVELTAAASFKGNLAWLCIRFNNSGFPDKKCMNVRVKNRIKIKF
ncbi:hypothetical protein [Okeania sp.]|uniref:hypothetical protein n=1 Tax=Okeania sp. TaxID=3100323 RepID=UPI002B4B0908|nr:hypothetical protein [Okeania sp.]